MTTMDIAASAPPRAEANLKPVDGLLGFAKWTIYAYLAFGIVYLATIMAGMAINPDMLLDDDAFFDTQVEMGVMLCYGLSAVGYSIAFVISAIAIARFTFRSMRNLHLLNEPSAEMPAGWTVGWYFIPIGNLFKPVQGMGQILDGSFAQAGKLHVDTPGLSLWWGCWLVGTVLSRVAGRALEGIEALVAEAVAISILMISALALLKILSVVREAQSQMIAARAF